jgi:protein-disulfide isomerase
MNKKIYLLAGTALVLVAAALVGARVYRASQPEPPKVAVATRTGDPGPPGGGTQLERPHSHALGPGDAKVTVVEFLDPECETCRQMYPMVKHLMAQYPGRVRLVVRYMPFHQNSMLAIAALEAAAEQGKYWEMLDTLFVNQPQWGDHAHPRPDLIPELAAKLGLDMGRFNTAVGSNNARGIAARDQHDGQALGVTGTPTFFVNGKKLEQLGYEQLQSLIEQALAR